MRHFAVLIVCVSLLSAGPALGGIPANVKLTVVAGPKGSSAQGREAVRAEAVVSRINTSEQLKAVALELLDHLKTTYPNSPAYTMVLSNDARMLKIGNYLAVAVLKEGKTVVTGGIPTAMDIRVMKASQVAVRRPDERAMQVAYEVALLRKETAGKGKAAPDPAAYARIARKQKMKVSQVVQFDREITQYYKAFAGKAL